MRGSDLSKNKSNVK